jgi:lipopolysaccharide biosynthesis glycosyltransferase
MDRENKIHIGLAFDHNFITPVYVLLTSIFYHNKANTFSFHAITSDVSVNDLNGIQKFVEEKGSAINFYEINDSLLQDYVIPHNSYYTKATYYRLYFPSLMPSNVAKYLYLDTDIIVKGNLKALYETDIEDVPVAACPDNGTIGVYEKGKYFNAGVLLVNTIEWQKMKISEQSFKYLTDFPEKIKYVDQDALNFVLKAKWKKLDNTYNLTFNDIPSYFSRAQLKEYSKGITIVHYTGRDKPWSATSANRLGFLYHHYLKLSPHSYKKKYTENEPFTAKNFFLFVKVRLIELICEFSFLRYVWRKKQNVKVKHEKIQNIILSSRKTT